MLTLAVIALALLPSIEATRMDEPPLRAGLIGCDTSHVIAFTQILNRAGNPAPLNRVRVVAAFPGGSPDIPSSAERLAGYVKQLKEEFGIEIVDSIPALLEKVDVVLLESVDGRPHLQQATPVIKSKKPLFIDKPVAGSLRDAIAIFEMARDAGVPCFSSSSLRFSPNILVFRNGDQTETIGDILGASVFAPCALEEHHPDLFWYGIHGVEVLFTIMGTGCQSVARVQTKDTDVVTGVWDGGRVGTFRGLRSGKEDYGATVFGSKEIATTRGYGGYQPLIEEICKFFDGGTPQVSAEETIEIFAFMEAADESKRRGGAPVTLESVLEKARLENAKQK
jgi:predicted dehydrogenase